MKLGSAPKNVFYIYLSSFLNGVLGYLAVGVTLTQLGFHQYGIFSIYLIVSSYSLLFEFGIARHLTVELSKAKAMDDKRFAIQNALVLFSVLSLLLLVLSPGIVYILTHLIFPVASENFAIVKAICYLSLIDYLLSVPASIKKAYTVSEEQFKRLSRFNALSGIFRYSLMIISVLFTKNLIYIVSICLLYRLVDLILLSFLTPKLPSGFLKISHSIKSVVLRFGEVTSFSSVQILHLMMLSLGAVIANYYFGLTGLGVYQASYGIASKLWFFSNGIGLVAFPKFSKMQQLNESHEAEKFHGLFAYFLRVSWLSYFIVATAAIMALKLIQYPAGLISHFPFMSLMFYGFCMNAHSDLSYNFLQSRKNIKPILYVTSITMLIFLLLSTFFKSIYALDAIAISFVMSQLLYAVLMDSVATKSGRYDYVYKAGIGLIFLLFAELGSAFWMCLLAGFLALFLLINLYIRRNYISRVMSAI